jgi:hypothetical protein
LQTEEPYWLAESYSDAISNLDIGPINRAFTGSQIVETLILTSFDPHASYVDWGGGYGIFTRHMRDLGYDYYWRDLHCENLFAKQFVAAEGRRYELLTAFEVFEHLVDPIGEIETMLHFSRNLFFTTLLLPDGPSDLEDWWYFSPEHGQHVSFYTRNTLEVIADRFGLHLNSDGVGNHLLSERQVSAKAFERAVINGRSAKLSRTLLRRRTKKSSLLTEDFQNLTGWRV